MADKDPVVEKGEEQLAHLDEEIQEARQHLKEQTHEGERALIDEGTEDTKDVDDNIAPPG
jgi:ribosomal protein S15P/S13E